MLTGQPMASMVGDNENPRVTASQTTARIVIKTKVRTRVCTEKTLAIALANETSRFSV